MSTASLAERLGGARRRDERPVGEDRRAHERVPERQLGGVGTEASPGRAVVAEGGAGLRGRAEVPLADPGDELLDRGPAAGDLLRPERLDDGFCGSLQEAVGAGDAVAAGRLGDRGGVEEALQLVGRRQDRSRQRRSNRSCSRRTSAARRAGSRAGRWSRGSRCRRRAGSGTEPPAGTSLPSSRSPASRSEPSQPSTSSAALASTPGSKPSRRSVAATIASGGDRQSSAPTTRAARARHDRSPFRPAAAATVLPGSPPSPRPPARSAGPARRGTGSRSAGSRPAPRRRGCARRPSRVRPAPASEDVPPPPPPEGRGARSSAASRAACSRPGPVTWTRIRAGRNEARIDARQRVGGGRGEDLPVLAVDAEGGQQAAERGQPSPRLLGADDVLLGVEQCR